MRNLRTFLFAVLLTAGFGILEAEEKPSLSELQKTQAQLWLAKADAHSARVQSLELQRQILQEQTTKLQAEGQALGKEFCKATPSLSFNWQTLACETPPSGGAK